MLGQITVVELAQRLATEAETLQLIDVQKPEEWAIAPLLHFTLLPLSAHPKFVGSLIQVGKSWDSATTACAQPKWVTG
ncbi:MAG: hypothetical protein P3X23_001945 [Thermosynechococcus sp. Uc]|nr:hypothetical protein [Thermosynechococcus sp. Uc]MDM7325868.1 hypothetical protein [Thermosynechococcus sp. Uc]